MRRLFLMLTFLAGILVILSCNSKNSPPLDPPHGFYAFHTNLGQGKEPFDQHKDLVVVLGEGQRLEFSREEAYRPKWVTSNGTYLVDEIFAEKERDANLDYTYIRLLETGDDRILVHWRYIPDIAQINEINESLDPVNIYGFQAAVHEIFSIFPDGTMEREMRDARGTRRRDWLDPSTITRQKLSLKEDGIEHGKIIWGEKGPRYPRPPVDGNPVKEEGDRMDLLASWTFDEGLQAHGDLIQESLSNTVCSIEGSKTLFKKGVSGTALAFDGYYTGVELPGKLFTEEVKSFTIESWVALDAYPYNEVAVVHQSTGFGKAGFFLGIDPYGHVFFRVGGKEVKSASRLKYGQWAQVGGMYNSGKLAVIVNGKVEAETDTDIQVLQLPGSKLIIGRNNEKERCTDYVREFDQNISFVYSLQGLIDELRIYEGSRSGDQISASYETLKPEELQSDLALGVLPGETGMGKSFGARYTSLKFSEIWDGLWRTAGNDEVVVNFDKLPTSVVFWKGTNYAANWVTDNNRWFADQSSEIWGPHGCSEHMADKQNRMCYARIIESSPARVVIHWRYPCVDVGYICESERFWSDEYHTIYPDGSGVRKVYWNGGRGESPGFQDIQMLTNPGESALDVVHLQALSMANRKGDVADLSWSPPNRIPENPLEDADIELINSKSEYKVFLAFQGACFTPWGEAEQSEYTRDPFAGPWNHWPMHLVPSDGRFAVDNDRVTHFALAANDCAPEFESMVLYGFTNRKIKHIIPAARSWQTPPQLKEVSGAESQGYNKAHKAFEFSSIGESLSFSVRASAAQPLINPCFVIRNWSSDSHAKVSVDGEQVPEGSSLRQGVVRGVDGTRTLIIWAELTSEESVKVEIIQANE